MWRVVRICFKKGIVMKKKIKVKERKRVEKRLKMIYSGISVSGVFKEIIRSFCSYVERYF